MTLRAKPKQYKACRECGIEYRAWSSMSSLNRFCSPVCAAKWSQRKAAERRLMAERMAHRQAKAKVQTERQKLGKLHEKARKAFNEFIRERDYDRPCIVYGTHEPKDGLGWDAGHFKAKGSHPELRYNCWNVHKQSRANNRGSHKWSRYQKGTDALYEENLRARIGDARVDWLNGPHEPKQYRAEDLERITRIFTKRAKLYRTLREGRA